tara:strand:+ start:599 stop:775 length:177 start_codon:yes stop_codon:yes gene_type:complete
MNIDNTPIRKYILLDTIQKPCYAFINSAYLTEHEVKTKNYNFAMNRANKKYVLKKDWK